MEIGIELKIFDKKSNKNFALFEDDFDISIKAFDNNYCKVKSETPYMTAVYNKQYTEQESVIAFILQMYGYDTKRVLRFLKENEQVNIV